MIIRRAIATVCMLASFAVPARAEAQLPLRGGTVVTILRVDGTRERARLVSQAADPPRLLLADPDARRWGGGSWTRALPLSQVAAIEAPGTARFHGRRLVVATLVATIAGGMLGFIVHPDFSSGGYPLDAVDGFGSPRRSGRLEGAVAGIAAGGLLGTIVGLFIAPGPGPDRRWIFSEDGKALPDTAQVPIR
jgi:hypothetical protein